MAGGIGKASGRLLLALAAGLAWQCTERLAGGATEVGNSGIVSGRILTLDGAAADDARIRLMPAGFDPGSGDSLPAEWEARTDASGAYRIEGVVPGAYNVLADMPSDEPADEPTDAPAADGSRRTVALIHGIQMSAREGVQELHQADAKLMEPGSISFSLAGEPLSGYCYLPGTDVLARIDSAASVTGRLTLSGVPVGRFAELIHAVPGASARNLLGRPIDVKAGTDLELGPYRAWKGLHKITLDVAASGVQAGANLEGFPLLVRLNSGNFDFAAAKSNGEDIRITKTDGKTDLPFEIERWDALNRQAEIWVGVDTVFAGTATQSFLLFSGNPEAAGISDPGAVFDTSNGFVGAWHLGLNLQDATALGNHGTDAGSQAASGLVGVARRFDGKSRHIAVPDKPSLRFGAGDFAMSAWILADTLGGTHQVFSKRDAGANYEVQFYADGRVAAILLVNGNQGQTLLGKTKLQKGAWHHLAFVRDAGGISLYMDGVLEAGPIDVPLNTNPGSELWFGDDPELPGQECFRGRMDEVEFSRRARSAPWLRLLYVTQGPGAKAVQVVPVE